MGRIKPVRFTGKLSCSRLYFIVNAAVVKAGFPSDRMIGVFPGSAYLFWLVCGNLNAGLLCA
jgi:hypothetical protein